jgi:hypothetical protein
MTRSEEIAVINEYVRTRGVTVCPPTFAAETRVLIATREIAARLAALQLRREPTIADMMKTLYRWSRAGG